jgi:hypothetical protein
MTNSNLLYLGISVIVLGLLGIAGIIATLGNAAYNATVKGFPFVMVLILLSFMFVFGYITISMYLDDRKSAQDKGA